MLKNRKIRDDLMKAHGVRTYYEQGPYFLDRVDGRDSYSIFANEEGEKLSVRKAAAGNLQIALSKLPEASINGPIRTAMIKCELAAKHGKHHDDVSRLFCEVSELIWQATKLTEWKSAA